MSWQTLMIGVLPLLGVLIGAGLQFMAGRALEERKQLAQLRATAYADFFRAISALSSRGRTAERLGELADAKSRVCLYGTAHVASILAELERAGANLKSEQARSAVIRLVTEARKDTAQAADPLSDADIALVLFGPV